MPKYPHTEFLVMGPLSENRVEYIRAGGRKLADFTVELHYCIVAWWLY